jgi:hypothetical protein
MILSQVLIKLGIPPFGHLEIERDREPERTDKKFGLINRKLHDVIEAKANNPQMSQ